MSAAKRAGCLLISAGSRDTERACDWSSPVSRDSKAKFLLAPSVLPCAGAPVTLLLSHWSRSPRCHKTPGSGRHLAAGSQFGEALSDRAERETVISSGNVKFLLEPACSCVDPKPPSLLSLGLLLLLAGGRCRDRSGRVAIIQSSEGVGDG